MRSVLRSNRRALRNSSHNGGGERDEGYPYQPAGDTVADVFGSFFACAATGRWPDLPERPMASGYFRLTTATWRVFTAVSATKPQLLSGRSRIQFVTTKKGLLGRVALKANAWDGHSGVGTATLIATCLVNTAPTLGSVARSRCDVDGRIVAFKFCEYSLRRSRNSLMQTSMDDLGAGIMNAIEPRFLLTRFLHDGSWAFGQAAVTTASISLRTSSVMDGGGRL